MGGIMEIDSVKASWGRKDRTAIQSMDCLHWLNYMHVNKGGRESLLVVGLWLNKP